MANLNSEIKQFAVSKVLNQKQKLRGNDLVSYFKISKIFKIFDQIFRQKSVIHIKKTVFKGGGGLTYCKILFSIMLIY